MADPFLGEIRMVASNFAPTGWAFCNGQTLSINEYQALFALLGTTYGGDGQRTFVLPDLQGRMPIHVGVDFIQGQSGGEASHALTLGELPAHNHPLAAALTAGNADSPAGNFPAIAPTGLGNVYGPPTNLSAAMQADAVGSTGAGASHSNLQPYLTVNFIIALQGIFPSRD